MIRVRLEKSGAEPVSGSDELLCMGEFTRVSRRRIPGAGSVILKEMLGPDALTRLRHERRILERLSAVEGVPRLARGAFPPEALAIEDSSARPLPNVLRELGLEIPALVRLAARVAGILAEVHRQGVVHRNLTPDNLLVTPGLEPVLVDFNFATTFAEERPAFVHHREITGTLCYLAPEQTGRTGRGVDQRADLYGLGATLYQLTTGVPPFQEKDPLQLIHDILALVPVPPAWRSPRVPRALSDIIMRLLEKEPDRRYQSAQGVAHDLSRMAAALERGESLGEDFVPGERDFAFRLSPPSRLIGREREVAALTESFEGAIRGEGSCLLVTGAPGVGKSTLVNELRPQVAARRGFFTTGKFDQYRRDLTADGVYQAFRGLGRLLLAEPEAEHACYRRTLLESLGVNAGRIAATLPEFALLMGDVPEAAGDDTVNVKERLVQASLDILRAVASPERPLVMVVDDLQWAAPTPLGLVEAMAAGEAIPGFLLVGSFRDDKPTPSHTLYTLTRPDQVSKGPLLLKLENLAPREQSLFIQEMLRLEPHEAEKLARVVSERTGGNPYDTTEFINALRRDGALMQGGEGWKWREEEIRRHLGEGDVVELLDGRLKKLPAGSQELIGTMACLGGEVERELLALAAGLNMEELEERLVAPLEDGVVVSVENGRVRFRHDRVQQAAYRALHDEPRRRFHLCLARRLSQREGLEPLAAEQYLPALEVLEDRGEKRRVVDILFTAAVSTRGINFREGVRFLEAALSLLDDREGEEEGGLVVTLESERQAALYSLGRLEEADQAYRRIERLSRSPLQRADAACLQVCSLTSRALPQQAVALGLEFLRELGFALPEPAVLEGATRSGLADFYRWMESGEWRGDLERPELADPTALAAARMMNRIIPPAYFCNDAMISWWLVTESRRLWAEHGPCAALVGPLSHLAFVTISLSGEFRLGGAAVRHVLEVSESRGWEADASQSRFLYCMTVAPWFAPLEENVARALRAEQGLVQGGDLLNACLTYYASIVQLLDCAPTLERFAAELDRAAAFAARTGNAHTEAILAPYRTLARQLRGEPGLQGRPRGRVPAQEVSRAAAGDDWQGTALSHVVGAISAALNGDAEQLALHAARAKALRSHLVGTYAMAQASLTMALSLAQQARTAAPPERERLLALFDEERLFIAGRAEDAPGTFLHLSRWLDAERGWAVGERETAAASFDAALSLTRELRLPWQRALITERAALFQLEMGLSHVGGMLMAEAKELYLGWGAIAKVRKLEAAHPVLRPRRSHGPEVDQAISADAIDLLAILRASQALSSETSLERLTALVVELLEVMTGATAVSLLVMDEEGGRWRLLPGRGLQGTESLPLERAAELRLVPLSLFHYARRTLKPLMVEDATVDDRFRHDPYLAGCRCCSALAVPILNQRAPRAVLLLENRLSRGAFTTDLVDAVTLVAGQLAVSLENALLYERLEERVRERTRELQEAQSELMAAARHAGMAEIANNVLHNVGNVLNSVNVSAGVAAERIREWRVWGLSRAVELMEENSGDLGHFLTHDPKGRLLPGYLKGLARNLSDEQREMVEELSRLVKSVDHIKDIVATQQCHAGAARVVEPVQVRELIEDALRLNLATSGESALTVERDFSPLPLLPLDRARVLQILINLVSNASHAMEGLPHGERRLTVTVELVPGRVRITLTDRGEGIAGDNLSRIFSHGFTTRKNGHGFGLHASALAAREMGGTLTARSEGAGRGASFVLELPVPEEEP